MGASKARATAGIDARAPHSSQPIARGISPTGAAFIDYSKGAKRTSRAREFVADRHSGAANRFAAPVVTPRQRVRPDDEIVQPASEESR